MEEATLIYPHQLFKQHPALYATRVVYLVEEFLFFRQYHFHQQKIWLHRASMKAYADFLLQKNYRVVYIESIDALSDTRKLLPDLASEGIRTVHYADSTDNWIERRLKTQARLSGIELKQYRTPGFINSKEELDDYLATKKTYFQTDFYIAQRKKRKILLEYDEKPVGGQWSFDADNRARFPKNKMPPILEFPVLNKYAEEARQYVQKHFPHHYGQIGYHYPTNFTEAEKWLDDFLVNRFHSFGIYEDAIVAGEHFLYHSVLTPMLNTGLLEPQQVVDRALDAAINYDIPLNSLEGFIRQLIGWREFVRMLYEKEGSRQRTNNYWGFTRKIPASFWTGNTGILPVDTVIKKLLSCAYSHHIERLMVMGNFMLLCEFDPDEVYKWFMELYIDSYDWVMVPNVYGMTQFADGGLMMTKPYISGSNYLVKMGDYRKGPWQQVWDGLFWRFMHVHRSFFTSNPRLGMLVNTFDKMPPEKKQLHLDNANKFLQTLDEANGYG